MRTRKVIVWVVAATVATLPLLPATGAENSEEQTLMAAKGRVTFRIYCANCHGEQARGDGSLAELLTVKPADLTRIAKRNDGRYPADRVRALIDGRNAARGHGLKEMPIWGDAFQKTLQPTWTEETDDERARRKIDEVVEFLRSIQEPRVAD